MSTDVLITVGKANDGRLHLRLGDAWIFTSRTTALWLHGELTRALDVNAPNERLRAQLEEQELEILKLRKSVACHRGAYTRAKKRRRGSR